MNVDHAFKGYILFNSDRLSSTFFSWCTSDAAGFVNGPTAFVNSTRYILVMPLVIQSATPEGVRLYAHEPPLETSPDLPIVTAVLSIFIWKNIDRMMPASIRHSILHIFFCALHVDTLVICFEKLPFMISFQILVIFLTELFTLCNLFRSASRARPVADSSAAFRIILDQHGRR